MFLVLIQHRVGLARALDNEPQFPMVFCPPIILVRGIVAPY